jgi:hypothetical protein
VCVCVCVCSQISKLLVYAMHIANRGRRPCHLGGACDVSKQKKSLSRCVFESAVVFFFLLEWRVMSTVTWFIVNDVIFSLLVSKLVLAMQIFIVVFWFMGISSLVPNILISNLCFWLFCKFFICFQFYPSIGICDFFQFDSHYFGSFR